MANVKSVGTTDSGHRTETRIVGLLRRSGTPLDVAEIATRLQLHPNGVRTHLQRLEGRRLVRSEPARGSVGRPRMLWSVTPRAVAEADLPHTGWAMARSLARAIPATPARLREVEAAGVTLGSEMVDEIGEGALSGTGGDPVHRALGALGFAPVRQEDGTITRYQLQTCPYAEAVRENPAVVCTLHKGVVRGVLERLRPDAELTGFVVRPPEVAGCIIEVEGPGVTGDSGA